MEVDPALNPVEDESPVVALPCDHPDVDVAEVACDDSDVGCEDAVDDSPAVEKPVPLLADEVAVEADHPPAAGVVELEEAPTDEKEKLNRLAVLISMHTQHHCQKCLFLL